MECWSNRHQSACKPPTTRTRCGQLSALDADEMRTTLGLVESATVILIQSADKSDPAFFGDAFYGGRVLGRRCFGMTRDPRLFQAFVFEPVFVSFHDGNALVHLRLIEYTRAGPLPVRFLVRLASAALPRFVAASSSVIPSRLAMR